ncbi:SdrD B-like domain-containing protein [Candidatus Electrothrix sp.]|uniref:SdrD B-like domain-containing protein n=2 Tax=Candidatus Electrothrix sp. TaxID=2170559 RepID=UPI004056E68A
MTAQDINRLDGQRWARVSWLFDFMDMMMKKICWITGALILSLLPVAAQADNPDGELRIEIISAYNLVVDSNVTTPATYAPEAATLGAKVCNDGTEAMHEVQVYIGDYIEGGTSTPGSYPVFDSAGDSRTWLADTGEYSLTHESGSFANNEDASRAWVGTLEPGECRVEYWVVSYPRCVNVGGTPQEPPCDTAITGGSTTADDLSLSYDIWATGSYGAAETPLEAEDSRNLTLRSEISASANKIWPNGDNKVPDEYKAAIQESLGWDTWTPTGSNPFPGQVFETQGIWYDLGNVNQGFDNNNDGVPDQNAWLQPVGIPDVYDPGCFRLVGTYGILIVKLSGGGEKLIPFKDQMYFENIPDNTGVVGLVFYEYAALNGKCTGTLTPYQEVASGYLNEKFSGDYGTAFQITTQEPLASIAKGVSPETAGLGSTLTYTMTVTNPPSSSYPATAEYPGGLTVTVGDPDSGNPLVVRDTIPEGTQYVYDSAQVVSGSGITDVTILYTLNDGTTTSTKPANQTEANNVVALEWRANTGLVNDSTMTVGFQATVPGTYTEPFVSNTGCAAIGSGPCFDEDDAVTKITGSTSITGTVFEDDGTGSNNGNGTYDTADAGEVGIAGVPVGIYYDADGSGTYSEGDFLWEEVTTLADGSYTSSSTLPPGDWFAVVGDLPVTHDGWASTTGTVHGVTTTIGEATALDTGFAPALTLDKQFVGASPIKEGDVVTYTIDLNNELYAEGVAVSGGCEYLVWSSAESVTNSASTANKQFLNIPNAFGTQGPDGAYASGDYTGGNNQFITGSSFNIDPKSGNIIKVEALAQIYIASALTDDSAMFELYGAGAQTSIITTADLNTAVGAGNATLFSWDVTSLKTWDWTVFASASEFGIGLDKTGQADTNTIYLDALGYRITTDAVCENSPSTIIDPLPLYDTFDANKIEFASASPVPDRLVPYDDGDPTTDMYRIEWDNLGPLNPSETTQVTVNFTAMEPAGSPETVTNTAEVKNAYFTSGTPANDADDAETVNLNATASIGDFIWSDTNGDGIQDAGEPGIPGVTVYLCTTTDPCVSGAPDAVQTTTDSDGHYQFDYLDGTYYMAVDTTTLPDGFNATPTGDPDGTADGQTSVTVSGNTDNMDQDWGFNSTAGTITGSVWQDFDGDTNRDDNDTPFAGWIVTLYNSDGTVAGTTTTNADGTYIFGDLSNGDYYTTVTPPAGYTQTYDYDSILNNNSGTLTVNGNTFISDVDFAYQTGDNSIGDTLYVDLNGDGIEQTGEPGISDVTVSLYLDSGSVPGVLDPGDVLLGSEVTDSNGQYDFTNLPDGDYLIVPDEDDVDLPMVQQTGDPDESGVCTVCDGITSVTVTGGQDIDTADFGYEPDGGKIGDSIYWDVNGDGTQGAGEPGIEGVEVYLCTKPVGSLPCDPTDSEYVGTATTDADGKYLFYGLPDDDYVVTVGSGPGTEINDADQTADPDNNGLVCTDPLAYTCDSSQDVTINGNSYMGADFGYEPPLFIGDQLFIDMDGDGSPMENNDLPLAYVTVTLTDCGPDKDCATTGDNETYTTQTDENGNYAFVDGLVDGNKYIIEVDTNDEDLPAEYGALTPSYNGHDSDGTTDSSIELTLGSVPIDDADMGFKFPVINNTLSGTVCLEGSSVDGYCGSGLNLTDGVAGDESAYEGTTVYVSKWIDDGDGIVESGELFPITQTVTDENGDYSFTGLPSVSGSNESYLVSLDAPADLLELTTKLADTPPDTPADALKEYIDLDGHTTSVWQSISVADGNIVAGLDFAFQQTAAFDFGDLPLPFETKLAIDGARHLVPDPVNPDLYLGAGVTIEIDGKPSVGAIADEDDGIVPVNPDTCNAVDPRTSWNETDGGAVEVTAVGDGWLLGWIDFNGDGSLNGDNELIINEALSGGDTPKCIKFSIPADAFDGDGNFKAPGYARFRLFPVNAPALSLPRFAFKGDAKNGEVEDYLFNLGALSAIGDEILLLKPDGTTEGIEGVVVELQNEFCNAGVDCPTAVTDANGHYLFTGVGLGDYTVVVKEGISGLTQVYDPDSTVDGQHPVSVTTAGTEYLDADFWYAASAPTTGTIGDRIWNDADGDGVQDLGESGIGGITVVLKDSNGDPVKNSNGEDIKATTNPDGSYLLTDVPEGSGYTVEVSNPPSGGTSTTGGHSTTVDVGAGETVLTADFGYQFPEANTSDIGDTIYHEDIGGIAGVTVVLKDTNGDIIAQDVTDSNGNYLFPGLPPGDYTVEVTDTNGQLDSYVLTVDPDSGDALSESYSLTTVADTDYLDVDFGYNDPVPTYATVSSFNAYVNTANQIVLEWTTASEIGTIGFHLERLNEQSGEYQAVTKKLLPGMLAPPHGGTYRFVDKQAKPGKGYTYRVVEVALDNQGVISGPYVVQASKALPVNNQMFADGPEGYTLAHQDFSRKQLKRFTARSKFVQELAAAKKKKTGNTLKIPVKKNGLVYLTAVELAELSGMTRVKVEQSLRAKKCLLTLSGESIPVITSNTGSGLWFYGQGPGRKDVSHNVYLLELGKKGVKMKNTPGRPEKSVEVAQSYLAQVRLEENHQPLYFYNINKPLDDFWAWEYLFAYGNEYVLVHTVDTPYVTGEGMAMITVNLVSVANKKSSSAAPYKVAVLLNGHEIGTTEWSEKGAHSFQSEIPANWLYEDGNEVQIVSQLNRGVNYSLIYLDSIEVDYQRSYEVVDSKLSFSAADYDSVTIRGFKSSNVLALDITEPTNPLRLRTLPGKNQAGEYTITVSTKPGHDYYVVGASNVNFVGSITVDTPSQLRSAENQADYLVITSINLMDSAQRLADHRASEGMRTMIVDIEDVQDEFSHSLPDPEAIRDFLSYVYTHWSLVPKYVTLIGDGSYDYNDYMGYGAPLVPSVVVSTPDGFYPSDSVLADVVDDDGVPEYAIGRIPVVDSEELDRYIDKVMAYEHALEGGSKTMTLVTDQKDPLAGDFRASTDQVAALMPEYVQVDRLDADTLGYNGVKNGINVALREGSDILHYTGHSSWIGYGSNSSLMSSNSLASMNDLGSPMLMVSMACSAASFGYPPMDSVGESALLQADGAAVGFFGATGLSHNYLSDIMAEGFYKSLFDPAITRIGEAVQAGKRHYQSQGMKRYPLDIYNLLGDPAAHTPVNRQ